MNGHDISPQTYRLMSTSQSQHHKTARHNRIAPCKFYDFPWFFNLHVFGAIKNV